MFIAGGIGITPFMSMLRQAANDGSPGPVLLCTNRRPEDTPFLGELQELERQNGNFRLVATMTDLDGFVYEATIRHFVADAPAPVYYLAGPLSTVEAMKNFCAPPASATRTCAANSFTATSRDPHQAHL